MFGDVDGACCFTDRCRSGLGQGSVLPLCPEGGWVACIGSPFGFSVAGMLDVPVYKRFSLRPELVLMNQGGSYEAFENSTTPTAHSCYYYSIQVPLNVVLLLFLSMKLSWEFLLDRILIILFSGI